MMFKIYSDSDEMDLRNAISNLSDGDPEFVIDCLAELIGTLEQAGILSDNDIVRILRYRVEPA